MALEVWESDFSGLLREAARGLASLVVQDELPSGQEGNWLSLTVEGRDQEDILVSWLNEIIFIMDTEGTLPHDARILESAQGRVAGEILGVHLPFELKVKAATYHGVKISRTPQGIAATIVFDV